jgi:2-polyprenyl-3-methyl-5-hydroxy-6-metoxy-1,4-benzoquinol methylase
MPASLASRPEHLQQAYSAYEKARPAFAAEIARVFLEKSGGSSLRGKNLLDVGCGNGEISEAFSSMGLNVTAVEYSLSRVMKMATNGLSFRLVAGDGHCLPLASNCFDFVVLADVLEHVSDPGQVMREVARVVRPGALVFIGATNRCSIANVVSDPHYSVPFIPLMSKRLASWYVVRFLKLSTSFNVEKYFLRRQLIRHIEAPGFASHDLPVYRERLGRGQLGISSANGVIGKILSVSWIRQLAVDLSSQWIFKTFVAPTFYFIGRKQDNQCVSAFQRSSGGSDSVL